MFEWRLLIWLFSMNFVQIKRDNDCWYKKNEKNKKNKWGRRVRNSIKYMINYNI